MTTKSDRTIKGSVTALLLALVCCVLPTPGQAATVTQLDITSESISLNFGVKGTLSGTFNQSGQLIMGQFQPPPNIFAPFQLSHLTVSIFSSSGQPLLNLPPPSGATSGNTMTVDVSSLFASLSSTQWGGWMTPDKFGSVNIGGTATGSFDQATTAFNISWTHAFTGLPFLTSGTFSFQGTAQLVAAPLPAAAWLFGSGLLGLAGAMRKKFGFA